MKYFQKIYQAAKERKSAELKALFKKGACVDTLSHVDSSFSSPAGLLAREGDLDSAEYLVNFFGANPIYVAQGLLLANNQQEANKWMTEYDLNQELLYSDTINKIRATTYKFAFETKHKPDTITTHDSNIEARVITGEFDLDAYNKLHMLHKSDYLNAAAHGGHIYLCEAIFNDSKIMHRLPSLDALFNRAQYANDIGFPVYRLQSKKLALHAFSFIQSDKFLAALLEKIGKKEHICFMSPFKYDVEKVMDKARKIRAIMQSDNVGYTEALSVCDKRNIKLPPLLQTSLPFYKKTTHIKTYPGTVFVGKSERKSMLFYQYSKDIDVLPEKSETNVKTNRKFGFHKR